MLAFQRELFVAARIGSELVGAAMAGYDGQCGWVYWIVMYPAGTGRESAAR
jgi:hypothetical protein